MAKILLTLDSKLDALSMSRYELAKKTDIPYQTITRYYKNQTTRYESDFLLKICLALDCNIQDIITIIR